MQLPLISVSSLPASTQLMTRAVGKQIDQACRSNDFFAITGHSIDARPIRQVAKDFSELSLREIHFGKDQAIIVMHYRLEDISECLRTQEGIGDYHEAVDFLKDLDTGRLAGKNHWSRNPQQLKTMYLHYFKDMLDLGKALMGAIALGPDVEEDFFEEYYSDPFWIMRMIHYPLGSATSQI